MKRAALRALRAHPMIAFFVLLGASLTLLVATMRAHYAEELASAAAVEASEGRGILGRAWFDRWPDAPTTDIHLLIFLAGGIGVHEHGAQYKFALELFEFERQGKHLDVSFLHDGARAKVDFSIERCSDLPPFDACLRLHDDFRGPRTYYGFADDEELARRLPWTVGEMALARSRAGAR